MNAEPSRDTRVFVNENVLQMYEIYRKRIEHEDNLINQRTSWFITLQAFLFTSVALIASRLDSFEFAKFSTIFAFVGIAICVTTALSVIAAHWAIAGTVSRWKSRFSDELIYDSELVFLPAIAGSGAGKFSIARGKVSSFLMPGFIGIAWVFLLALVWTDPCEKPLSTPFNLANTCVIKYEPAKEVSGADFVVPVAPGF